MTPFPQKEGAEKNLALLKHGFLTKKKRGAVYLGSH